MNVAIEHLLTRRSARAFEKRPIGREELEQTVKVAPYALSGRGLQTWQFTMVRGTGKIQKLVNVIGKELGRDGYDMYCPIALIILSNEKSSPFDKEDNACALENILLVAHSLSISSVWINQFQGIYDAPVIRAILDELKIPADHVVYGMVALGYPVEAPNKQVVKTGKVRLTDWSAGQRAGRMSAVQAVMFARPSAFSVNK